MTTDMNTSEIDKIIKGKIDALEQEKQTLVKQRDEARDRLKAIAASLGDLQRRLPRKPRGPNKKKTEAAK